MTIASNAKIAINFLPIELVTPLEMRTSGSYKVYQE